MLAEQRPQSTVLASANEMIARSTTRNENHLPIVECELQVDTAVQLLLRSGGEVQLLRLVRW